MQQPPSPNQDETQKMSEKKKAVKETKKDLLTDYKKFYNDEGFNDDILKNLINIELKDFSQSIQSKPTICLVGIGQSGSGKTSTLIKFIKGGEPKKDEDGVLLELLKKEKTANLINVTAVEIHEGN